MTPLGLFAYGLALSGAIAIGVLLVGAALALGLFAYLAILGAVKGAR